MSDTRMAVLTEARRQGRPALAAVRKVREDGLFEAGKEFNVALDLKSVYGLTVPQLHDVVGWFRGTVTDEELAASLPD